MFQAIMVVSIETIRSRIPLAGKGPIGKVWTDGVLKSQTKCEPYRMVLSSMTYQCRRNGSFIVCCSTVAVNTLPRTYISFEFVSFKKEKKKSMVGILI